MCGRADTAALEQAVRKQMEERMTRHELATAPPSVPPSTIAAPTATNGASEQSWKLPPAVSNWKNARGYTIPLDKRLAQDGKDAGEVNERFAKLAEALSTAERKAREEVGKRAELSQKLLQLETGAIIGDLPELQDLANTTRALQERFETISSLLFALPLSARLHAIAVECIMRDTPSSSSSSFSALQSLLASLPSHSVKLLSALFREEQALSISLPWQNHLILARQKQAQAKTQSFFFPASVLARAHAPVGDLHRETTLTTEIVPASQTILTNVLSLLTSAQRFVQAGQKRKAMRVLGHLAEMELEVRVAA